MFIFSKVVTKRTLITNNPIIKDMRVRTYFLAPNKDKFVGGGGEKKYRCAAPTSLAPLFIKVDIEVVKIFFFACLSLLLRRISVAKIVGVEYINERKRVLIPL